MKKIVKRMSSFLLMVTLSAHANIIPIQVLAKCKDVLKPVPYENIAISTTAETPGKISGIEFKVTDGEGYFYIDNSYHGKFIRAYLADNRSIIIVDCRSRLMPVKAQSIILGERGSSCPAAFCQS